ncbi:recombinase zinc beta ribbon domain-containing protein [Skermania pinensis]
MSQKAKAGGTPGKAPLGYLNIRRIAEDGSILRTVEVDPVRGPLIAWAFTAYATGDWTLKAMTMELERRGLTTKPGRTKPAVPIKFNSLHKILTTPYYRGEVVYQGAHYPGKHQPLTDPLTWTRVQQVLASHATGEKQRTHPHYLKSSVFCGNCGSRLIITNSKNRQGTVYPYFICLGRHQKTTDCQQKAVLIERVEELVEAHYDQIQLDPALGRRIETMLRAELRSQHASSEAEQHALTTQKTRLEDEQLRLLQAHYAGAVPVELLKREQERMTNQLASIDARLTSLNVERSTVEGLVGRALEYAIHCASAYRRAKHAKGGSTVRRLYNQALFTKIYVDEDRAWGELAEPFRTVMDPEVKRAARAEGTSGANRAPEEPVLGLNSSPDATRSVGEAYLAELAVRETKKPVLESTGLKESMLVPPTGFEPALPP